MRQLLFWKLRAEYGKLLEGLERKLSRTISFLKGDAEGSEAEDFSIGEKDTEDIKLFSTHVGKYDLMRWLNREVYWAISSETPLGIGESETTERGSTKYSRERFLSEKMMLEMNRDSISEEIITLTSSVEKESDRAKKTLVSREDDTISTYCLGDSRFYGSLSGDPLSRRSYPRREIS